VSDGLASGAPRPPAPPEPLDRSPPSDGGGFAISTTGLAPPASGPAADAKRRHSFDVTIRLSPSPG